MANLNYQVTEFYTTSQVFKFYPTSDDSEERMLFTSTRFYGEDILKCKKLAEQFYISKLAELDKLSEFNDLYLFEVHLEYLVVEKKNGKEILNRNIINYPKGISDDFAKEMAESEEALLKKAGINIPIPLWSERLEILKKKYGYKE